MSTQIDREGVFLAKPVEWAIEPSRSSQAIALAVKYQILGQFDGDQLHSDGWADANVVAYGRHYWAGSTGQLLADAVERMIRAELWDGDLRTVHNQMPPDVEVRITITNEPYNGRDQFKVAWVNHRNDTGGGGFRQADDSQLQQLEARFGSMLRATKASVEKEMAETAPAGSGAAPAPAPKTAPPAGAGTTPAAAPTPDDDGLPF